ncbi:MAG: ABC transporter ATP-binding protein [Leptonema sp. (in: Bacteria)]|nr:ABC transporter ATP-binding protein [Leptonema sp. (in: bacteria)]
MEPFLSLKNIQKTYRGRTRPALNKVSLDMNRGQVVALLGPNGAGKTTLIKILMGLVKPDEGSTLFIDGQPANFDIPAKLPTGYMPQNPAFPDNLRVSEILDYLLGFSDEEPVHLESLLNTMGLHSFYDRRFRELSGGMKQKLSVVQAFAYDRPIIVLDEPTAGLDPFHSTALKKLVQQRKSNGVLVLLTTHILSEIEELADIMVLLVDGQVQIQKSPAEFISLQKAKNLEEALSGVGQYA